MKLEDLKILSHLGTALWVDSHHAQRITVETLAAVSLLDLTPERSLERLSSLMLERASRDGIRANATAVGQAFFRLLPEERFVLSALHVARWSYSRIARVLGQPTEKVEEIAWGARLDLASALGNPVSAPYPIGSAQSAQGVAQGCPEYEMRRPWTQRFLDEELHSREKFFLQTHINECHSCRQALTRARSFYFTVDRMIPRLADDSQSGQAWLASLSRVLQGAGILKSPAERTFRETLAIFVRRSDIQYALLALTLLIAWKMVMG